MSLRELTKTSVVLLGLTAGLSGLLGGALSGLGNKWVTTGERLTNGEHKDSIAGVRWDSTQTWHRASIDTDRALAAQIGAVVSQVAELGKAVQRGSQERDANARRLNGVLIILCGSNLVQSHTAERICAQLVEAR